MVGGITDNQGAIEVQMDGRWGRVCHLPGLRSPKPAEFRALCRSLGYRYVLVSY